MPTIDSIGGTSPQNANVTATEAANAGTDDRGFVPNPLGLPLHDLALRPGTHRRVSFRATPGSVVSVMLRASEWWPLDILNASRAPATPPVTPPGPVLGGAAAGTATTATAASSTATGPAISTSSAIAAKPATTAALDATGVAAPTQAETITNLHAAFARPTGPGGVIRPGGVFDPFDPLPPLPPLPPIRPPTLPVEVVVSVRDGAELGRATLLAERDSSAPARVEFDGIDVNDVIDVTFINANDVAVICTQCAVHVDRRIRTSTTTMRNEMFLRTFNGAIRSLCPTITVEDGSVKVELHGEIAEELGLTNMSADVPESFTGGATFETTDLKIMGQGDLIPSVVALLQRRINDNLVRLGSSTAENIALQKRLKSHVRPSSFIEEVTAAYFDGPDAILDRVTDLITPRKSMRDRLEDAATGWLDDHPMLIDRNPHHHADPGFSASYALTGIHGKLGPIGLEIPEIRLSLFFVLNHKGKHIPAPFGDLPLDHLLVGDVRPSLHVDLDIADFDIDLDVPLWLDFVTLGTVRLADFIIEQGLEALADFLAGKAEQQVPAAVHKLMADHQEEYGSLIAATLATIADRDQEFHRSAATREQFAISTIDTNQLRVPHDPNAGRRPSPVQGINEQVPPLQPIDSDPFAPPVTVSASPGQLLQRIDHFVFVMMENRSFDHMLGHLSHPDHGRRSDVDGLDGSHRLLGGDLTGTRALPLEGPNPAFWPNLPHDHESIVRQINDGQMNGFASEYARKLARTRGVVPKGLLNDPERVLRFQTADVVDTYNRLARKYAICDRWFASVPAGTYPNRACYYSGVTPSLTNQGIVDEFGYLSDLTVFDLLNHANVDWKVFESDISFLRVFNNFRIEQDRIRPISELKDRFRPISKPSDPLKTVTFIDPNFTGFPSPQDNNDDQPPTDVRAGQDFIAGIVELIEQSSNWESTMLVITYDEHGGFADHVPPPGAPGSSHPPGGPTAISLSHPDAHTYGVRVPTFIVSPLVQPGDVSHQIFDHAAVFRTLLQRFAPEHVNSKIIPERVRRSRHLGEVLFDQLPLKAQLSATTSPVLAAAAPRGRARFAFDEAIDKEDAVWVLNQIGVPTRR